MMALAGLAPSDIDATIIGSVVPEATFNLVRLCQRYFGSEPLIVGRPDCFLGIGIDVDMPKEEVGADRVANAVAAQDRYKPPLIVIDFGTATTFDIVDRLGNYCGGVIAPGINLSLRALDMAAAQLPRIGIDARHRGRAEYRTGACNPAYSGGTSGWSRVSSSASEPSAAKRWR